MEKMAALQMLDVCIPPTDGRQLVLPRYTERTPEQHLLLDQLKLTLPEQPRPRITAEATVLPEPM